MRSSDSPAAVWEGKGWRQTLTGKAERWDRLPTRCLQSDVSEWRRNLRKKGIPGKVKGRIKDRNLQKQLKTAQKGDWNDLSAEG